MSVRITYSQLWRDSVNRLQAAGLANAQREALWILEHALGVSSLDLKVNPHAVPDSDRVEMAVSLVARREAREPLQYLLGSQEFYGREMMVGPEVLIPRPESELLIEHIRNHFGAEPSPLVIDVGTGSGCLAVTVAAELPEAIVIGSDRSAEALHMARVNAERYQVSPQIRWVVGDLLSPLLSPHLEGKVGAIIANLPYISHSEWDDLPLDVKEYEPRLALDGGPDGLSVYRRLVGQAPALLRTKGWLCMEIGVGQAETLSTIVEAQGRFERPTVQEDAQGIPRVVCTQRIA